MNHDLTYFEKRLARELEAIDAQIKELQTERQALSRQLAKARAERQGLSFATRKNSMNRILAENAIIEALRTEEKPLNTLQLYRYALSTNHDLKTSTFRSYLHRMKKRGEIKTAFRAGTWKLN